MRKHLGSNLLLLLCGLSPVFPAAIYLPVTRDFAAQGKMDTVELLVTNTDSLNTRRLTTFLLPTDSDGTVRPATQLAPTAVPAGSTVLLTVDPAEVGTGLLEVDAEPELVTSARTVLSGTDGGPPTLIQLPVISSHTLLSRGQVAHLQGLEHNSGSHTNINLFNLGHETGVCTVRVFRADGSQIQSTVSLSLRPLSQRLFQNAFALLQEDQASDARLEITCEEPFYAFASIVSDDPTHSRVIYPTLPDSALLTPEQGFLLPGTFFEPTSGDSNLVIELPLEQDVGYRRLSLEFDFFLNQWQNDLFHKLVGVNRTGGTLYFGIFLRRQHGGRTIVDIDEGDTIKASTPWQAETTYHSNIEFDTTTAQLTIRTFAQETLVHEVSGIVNHSDLRDDGNPVRIIFGQEAVAGGAFFPPLGWRFSNLEVRFSR